MPEPAKDKDKNKHLKGFITEQQFQQPQKPVNHETLVERIILDAIAAGKFDNLANEGQPLKVEEENPYVPEDMRMAYQILSRNGYAPPWVEMEKEVLADLDKAIRERDEHRRWLKRRLDDIKQGPLQYFMRDLRQLGQSHERWLKNYEKRLTLLNERIHSFNHVCPVENLMKTPFNVQRVLEEYNLSCPTIPQI